MEMKRRSEICAILVTLKRSKIMTMQEQTQHLCGKKPDPTSVISFLVCKAPYGLHPIYFVDLLSFQSPTTNVYSSQAGCLLCSPHNLSTSATQANSSSVLAIWSNIPDYIYTCIALLLSCPPSLQLFNFMNGITQPCSFEIQFKPRKKKTFSENKASGNNVVLSSIHSCMQK